MLLTIVKRFFIISCVSLFLTVPVSVMAEEGNLQFKLALYGWYTDIEGETAAGRVIDVGASDLVDKLDFAAFGLFEVHKGNWYLGTDVVFVEVSDDMNGAIQGVSTRIDSNLQAWVVSPYIGHTCIDNDQMSLSFLGGARYLSMDTDVDLNIGGVATRRISGDGYLWDGIIGMRGNINLTEKWYLPYHFDIGAGESDLTWQAFAGVGYRFSKVDVVAGYRYLTWEFDDESLLDDLEVSGVMAGVVFAF